MSVTRLKQWPKPVDPADQVETRQDEGALTDGPAASDTKPVKAPKSDKSKVKK